MELTIRGRVYCEEVANNRALKRLVEKRLKQWVFEATETKGYQSPTSAPIRFEVRFEREGDGHAMACLTRIDWDGQLWLGSGEGPDPNQALTKSILGLRPSLTENQLQRHETRDETWAAAG